MPHLQFANRAQRSVWEDLHQLNITVRRCCHDDDDDDDEESDDGDDDDQHHHHHHHHAHHHGSGDDVMMMMMMRISFALVAGRSQIAIINISPGQCVCNSSKY